MGTVYSAQITVDASVEEVWAVLVDVEAYAEWNHFNPRARTSLEVGAPVELAVRMWPWLGGGVLVSQTEQVRAVEAPHRLVWGAAILGGLVQAERIQTLETTPEGTRYRTVDTIGGVLGPMVALLFGNSLRWGFQRMADDLAARCA